MHSTMTRFEDRSVSSNSGPCRRDACLLGGRRLVASSDE